MRYRRSLRVAVACIAFVVGGCERAVPPPPARVEAAHGSVRAETAEVAAALVPQLDSSWQAVRNLVPGCRDVPVEAWIVRDVAGTRPDVDLSDAAAFSTREPARIVLPDADGHTMVHELVHVLTDDTWQALPAFVGEGLADFVAVRLAPDTRGARADMVLLLPRLPGFVLRVTSRPMESADPDASCNVEFGDPPLDVAELRDLLSSTTGTHSITNYVKLANAYSLGFVLASRVVERRGLSGLRDLCEAARAAGQAVVAPEALLEVAELPLDPALWWPLLAPAVGPAELQTLAGRYAQPLAQALLAGLPGTPAEIVARVEGGLVELSAGGDASVRLAEVPGLLQALRDELASKSATPRDSSIPVEGG